MRSTTIAAVIVVLAGTIATSGCASSSAATVSQSMTGVAERPDLLWMSLVGAVREMGGRVIAEDRAAGTLVGMMDVEGRKVQLDVYLRTPSRMGSDLTDVGKDDALFAAGRQHNELGYMRLEFFDDGAVVLSVITDGTASCRKDEPCAGAATVRYWGRLAGE